MVLIFGFVVRQVGVTFFFLKVSYRQFVIEFVLLFGGRICLLWVQEILLTFVCVALCCVGGDGGATMCGVHFDRGGGS